jgi:hypothetical protein
LPTRTSGLADQSSSRDAVTPTWTALLAAFAGIVLGSLAAALFWTVTLAFIAWGLAAIVSGWLVPSPRRALVDGLVFGVLFGSVLVIVGDGTDGVVTKPLHLAMIGLVSALCGAALSLATHLVRSRKERPHWS